LEKEHRDRRLNICTLTEQKEVDMWSKVNYGKSILSNGKWAKVISLFKREIPGVVTNTAAGLETTTDLVRTDTLISSRDMLSAPPPEAFQQNKREAELLISLLDEISDDDDDDDHEEETETFSDNHLPDIASLLDEDEGDDDDDEGDPTRPTGIDVQSEPPKIEATRKNRKTTTAPCLPKSDPPAIVLARVRFLLSDEGRAALPPHHMLFANSECIAVWAKTGRFSTVQSQIFLHSTALGNAKTATALALMISAQTVAVTSTVPAAGVLGWLGFSTTTTAQVGLLSINPWMIPLLAGYGIAAVGTPYFILAQGTRRWEKTTLELNDAFWQRATGDVYAHAIHHWSGLT
jgi:hypothetical protein